MIGKMKTDTILLLAVGAAAIYFITRKPTVPTNYYLPSGQVNPQYQQQYYPSSQSQLPGLIAAGGSAVSSLISSLFGSAPLGGSGSNQGGMNASSFL